MTLHFCWHGISALASSSMPVEVFVARRQQRAATALHAAFEAPVCMLQGAIDWSTILPHVCSRAPWLFNVRVGNAAAPYLHNLAPQYPMDQVAHLATKRGTSVISHLAKVLMCTMRTSHQASTPPAH